MNARTDISITNFGNSLYKITDTKANTNLLNQSKPPPLKQFANSIQPSIRALNLPKLKNLDFTIEQFQHVNPCKYRVPCVTVGAIDYNHTPLFLPEDKDCIFISVYGYYVDAKGSERLGNQSIYFTPDDAKIYIIDESTSNFNPRILNPLNTVTNRSNGARITYANDIKIHSLEHYFGNSGYEFFINGYTIKITENQPPWSMYTGRDLNKAWEGFPRRLF